MSDAKEFTKAEIGLILKELRRRCGMTQQEVASALGRKQQVIGHWETGYSQPDANMLFVLCALYGVTVDEAFGFTSSTQKPTFEENAMLEKYRALDDHGKKTVESVLAIETERINDEQEISKWNVMDQWTKEVALQFMRNRFAFEIRKKNGPNITLPRFTVLPFANWLDMNLPLTEDDAKVLIDMYFPTVENIKMVRQLKEYAESELHTNTDPSNALVSADETLEQEADRTKS